MQYHAINIFVCHVLPCHIPVRFNLQKIGAMRLLVATSEVCLCEVWGQVWLVHFPVADGLDTHETLAERSTKAQIFKPNLEEG